MIRSIEIENFRGIQTGKLEGLTPLTVLVGPNGCGKSTVLDALYLSAHQDIRTALGHVANSRNNLPHAIQWLFWKIGVRARVALRAAFDNGADRTVVFGQSPVHENDRKSALQASFTRRPDDPPELHTGVIKGGDLVIDALVQGTANSSAIGLLDLGNQTRLTPLATVFSQAVARGLRNEATSILQAVVPGLEQIVMLSEREVPVIYLEYRDRAVPAALSGEGIHLLLRICLELGACSGGVQLIEEPELHQHPRTLRHTALAILAAMRRGIQVAISTHSLELIDFLISETESDEELEQVTVIRLQLKGGCLGSVVMPGDEVRFARSAIEDDLR